MSEYALEVKNISKYFDGLPVIKDVSFSLNRGEIMGILGNNASAKSTMLRILGGTLPPDDGAISLFGKDVKIVSPLKAKKLGIISFGENVPLPENLTVAEALFLGAYEKICDSYLRLVNLKKMNRCAKELIDDYNFDINPGSKVGDLNVAQRQMMMLLRASVLDAKVLLLDNCFSLLDKSATYEIHRILKNLQKKDVTIIMTSQEYHHILDVASSIAIMENSRITISKLTDEIPKMFSGGGYPKLKVNKGPVLFECRNISYKNTVKDISLHVASGELIGVIGNPDSGRDTLSKLLCGDIKADIGKFYVKNQEVKIKKPADAKRKGIMMVPNDSQTFGVIPKIDLSSNIALSNYKKSSVLRFVVRKPHLHETTGYLAEKLGIKYNCLSQNAAYLSAGNKRKIAFARAIYSNMDIYLINEPTTGIDISGSIQIYNIMNELLREGKCILLFTSNIQEAVGMCDRIFVMWEGRMSTELIRADFKSKLFEHIDSNT